MRLPRFVVPAVGASSAALIVVGSLMAVAPAGPPRSFVTDTASWARAGHSDHTVTLHRRHHGSSALTARATPAASAPTSSTTPKQPPAAEVVQPPAVNPAPRQAGTSTATPSAVTPALPAPATTAAQTPGGAAPAGAVTSASAAPAADLPGWHLVLSQDFTKNAAAGQFSSVYPGWADYDGAHDTSGHGTYDSGTTATVSGGVLDEYLHTQNGSARVMALTPPAGGSHQTYGRYAVRFRSDAIPGYKIAWLLWPTNDNWSQGELDFPEADLDHTIEGYAHDVTGSPERNAWSVSTGAALTSWHTAVIEWSPSGLTYSLDGQSWHTSDSSAIPHNPMNWVLQTETAENGAAPAASASGHISIDWVAAWTAG